MVDGNLDRWGAPKPRRPKPDRQRQYLEHAIETAVTLGMVFGLASRQTEGILLSLLVLLKLNNKVPDHTTISRRKAKLGKVKLGESQSGKPIHILIDSRGLSVHVGQLRKEADQTVPWLPPEPMPNTTPSFSRYKALIGPTLRARKLSSQRVEVRVGCRILNMMTGLGMPDGVMI